MALTMVPIWPDTFGMNSALLELATALSVTPHSMKKWKLRGAVPHKYRLPLLELAEKQGVPLTSGDFEFGKKPKPRKRARQS